MGIYLIIFKKKGMTVHGPFTSKSRDPQMGNGLELNSVCKVGVVYMIQYATRSHFQVFDHLFGNYSRVGFSIANLAVGETVNAEPNHELFVMGSGLFPAQYTFKRMNVTFYGIDFKYNETKSTLSLSLWYKKDQAENNATMLGFI